MNSPREQYLIENLIINESGPLLATEAVKIIDALRSSKGHQKNESTQPLNTVPMIAVGHVETKQNYAIKKNFNSPYNQFQISVPKRESRFKWSKPWTWIYWFEKNQTEEKYEETEQGSSEIRTRKRKSSEGNSSDEGPVKKQANLNTNAQVVTKERDASKTPSMQASKDSQKSTHLPTPAAVSLTNRSDDVLRLTKRVTIIDCFATRRQDLIGREGQNKLFGFTYDGASSDAIVGRFPIGDRRWVINVNISSREHEILIEKVKRMEENGQFWIHLFNADCFTSQKQLIWPQNINCDDILKIMLLATKYKKDEAEGREIDERPFLEILKDGTEIGKAIRCEDTYRKMMTICNKNAKKILTRIRSTQN